MVCSRACFENMANGATDTWTQDFVLWQEITEQTTPCSLTFYCLKLRFSNFIQERKPKPLGTQYIDNISCK